MPTYELKCGECEHEFDVVHGINEPHPQKCPACGKRKLKQVFRTAPAYHNHFSPMHPRKNRGRGF